MISLFELPLLTIGPQANIAGGKKKKDLNAEFKVS